MSRCLLACRKRSIDVDRYFVRVTDKFFFDPALGIIKLICFFESCFLSYFVRSLTACY
jgi:hypothetical protein